MSKKALLFGFVSAPAFDPTSLFSGGIKGGWYDPSDMTTLWKDNARTTQATAAGDTIGAMDDKSGNGVHLTMATSGKRPTLRNSGSLWWLEFVAANNTALLYNSVSTWNSLHRTDVWAVQPTAWGSGATLIDGYTGNVARLYQYVSTPQVNTAGPTDATHLTISANHVFTIVENGASSSLTIDNNTANTGTLSTGCDGISLGDFGSGGGAPASLLCYGGIRIMKVLSGGDIASCRTFFGAKAGLSL